MSAEKNNPPGNTSQQHLVATSFEAHSGPIPPPAILEKYNQIVPNAAERIIRMAEKQSDHRMDLEKKVIDSSIFKSYLGMIFATGIAVYGLYIAKEIAIDGNPATAGIIAAIDIIGLISVGIYNGNIQKNEREQRKQMSSNIPTPPKR